MIKDYISAKERLDFTSRSYWIANAFMLAFTVFTSYLFLSFVN